MSAASNMTVAPAATRHLDPQAEAINLQLLRSEKSLYDALRSAEAASYGDQIRAAITQAIEQVSFVRRQLG